MQDLTTTLSTRQVDDRCYNVYALEGYLDAHTSERLSEMVGGAVEEGQVYIVLDMAGVTYVSSVGFGTLVALQNHAQENGGDLKIAAVSEKTQRMFDLLGFVHIMGIHETVDDAVASFAGGSANGG